MKFVYTCMSIIALNGDTFFVKLIQILYTIFIYLCVDDGVHLDVLIQASFNHIYGDQASREDITAVHIV